MKRFGLDLDGIVYQWSKTARYMLREILPDSPYTKDGALGQESTTWNYIQDNIRPEHWRWLWTEGVRLGLFRYGHLYPGSIKAVREIAETHAVVVITHRQASAVEDTLAFLSYMKLPLSGVHLLTDNEPKSEVNPPCDVYLDDKPDNIADLVRNTAGRVLLMDRPWNQQTAGLDPDAAWKRVHSWKEVLDELRRVG